MSFPTLSICMLGNNPFCRMGGEDCLICVGLRDSLESFTSLRYRSCHSHISFKVSLLFKAFQIILIPSIFYQNQHKILALLTALILLQTQHTSLVIFISEAVSYGNIPYIMRPEIHHQVLGFTYQPSYRKRGGGSSRRVDSRKPLISCGQVYCTFLSIRM